MNKDLDVSEHFRSMVKGMLRVKIPEREEDYLAPSTKLLKDKREIAEVECLLEAKKEESQLKLETLQQRKEELERKQEQLKESIIKFDKYIIENDMKRKRAEKNIHRDRKVLESKDIEIVGLKNHVMKLNKMKDRMMKEIEKYSKFQKFLAKTIETSGAYQEIHELLDRYETLKSNYEYLIDIKKDDDDLLDKETKAYNNYVKKNYEDLVEINERRSKLQNILDNCQIDSKKAETEWNHIQETAAVKTIYIGNIKMAIRNLYQIALKHKAKEDTPEISYDTDFQLKLIQEFIQDLTSISTELSRTEGNYTTPSSI